MEIRMFSLVQCAVASIFITLLSPPAVADQKWPIPAGVSTLEVNGYDLAFREMGKGRPLILIGGTLADYRYWDSQYDVLSKTRRVVGVSLRHHFPEHWDGRGKDYSIAQHALDIAALIKKLNTGKVDILGHSRGGTVALEAAKLEPDLINSLILADANGPGHEFLVPAPREESQAMQTQRRSLAAALASGDKERGAKDFLNALFRSPDFWDKALTPDRREAFLDNIGTASVVEVYPANSCADVLNLKFPILLITGENSGKIFKDYNAAFKQCHGDAAEVIIPKAPHAMNRANPAAFNAAVLQFLEGVR